jgi:hypothetical protein
MVLGGEANVQMTPAREVGKILPLTPRGSLGVIPETSESLSVRSILEGDTSTELLELQGVNAPQRPVSIMVKAGTPAARYFAMAEPEQIEWAPSLFCWKRR